MKAGSTRGRYLAAMITTAWVVGATGPRLAEARAAVAFPAESAESPTLTVVVDPDMLQSDAHRSWVETRAREVLERRPRALDPEDRIEVSLAGTTRNYQLSVRVLQRGQPLAEQPEPLVIKGSSDDLLAAVETAIDDAVDRLIDARKAEERAARARVDEEREERERTRESEAEEARRRELAERPYRPTRLGVAGAIAMGLGGAMVLSGAIVTARGRVDWGNDLINDVDYRPPGHALLAVGSAVLATGLTMLVVDVVQCKRDRVKCGERGRFSRRVAWGSRRTGVRW